MVIAISNNNLFYEGNTFRHDLMALHLLEHRNVCWINGRLHIYRDGLYVPGPDAIHGGMVELVPTLSEAKRREVFRFLSVYPDVPKRTIADARYIPFRSKVYDREADRFLPYDPSLVFLYRHPYDYKKDAERVPLVDNVLMQASCSNVEIFMLIAEMLGRGYLRTSDIRGSFLLYDEHGNSGKSTVLNMARQMYGPENCSYLSLQDLCERFRLAEIVGRCANIGDDIPRTLIPDSSIFKKLVTGEELIAEKKGENPFSFRSTAVLLFAANTLPPVTDRSDAFYSRLIIVPFGADFSHSKDKDLSLKNRHWSDAEMEYLVRISMDGLDRLVNNGDYTRPDCVTSAIAEYRQENDPVAAFLSEYGSVVYQPTELVYSDYVSWASRAGHKNQLTRPRFTRDVCNKLNLTTEPMRHKYFGGNTGRCFAERVTDVTVL